MAIETCDSDHMNNSGDLINTIRERAKYCFDLVELRRIAFNDIKLPKRKYMATKRCFYVKQITSISDNSQFSNKRGSSQWFRRKSSEILGIASSEYRIAISEDHSKVAVLRKNYKLNNEISIFSSDEKLSESLGKIDCSLKSSLLIGITNNGKRLLFTQFSSKTFSKLKSYMKFDLIGVNFDAIDGFYLEESDCTISICRSGLVSKCKVSAKKSETIMAINDNTLSIVLAHLSADRNLIWLNSESPTRTHTFIAIDVNSLDVLRVLQSDFFSVHKFSDNPLNRLSLFVVKSDPINGKLKKVVDLLTHDCLEKPISNFFDDIFDINCISLNNNEIFDSIDHLISDDLLIVLVTRNSFDVYVEYKWKRIWKKQMLFINSINVSELKAIRIIDISHSDSETNVTLLVITWYEAHLARLGIKIK